MSNEKKCALCEVSENDKPLVELTFKGKQTAVCSSCMPELIHGPGAAKLAEKFKD